MPTPFRPQPSSYRDPSGFLFYQDGILYRQVNKVFQQDFDHFLASGLYEQLTATRTLVPHLSTGHNLTGTANWYRTLQPEFIPFISYPYEWCFDMWKDAALTTLEAAQAAMDKGMMLKDASAYNLQWHRGRMMFLDTLSFERYEPGAPWIAYRQFCEQFLAPLALMHYLQQPLQPLLTGYPEGVPLGLAKKILPFRSRLHFHVFLHLHLHGALAEKRGKGITPARAFSEKKLRDLLRSLETAVRSFQLDAKTGVWSGYYEEAAQRTDYLQQKQQIVDDWVRGLPCTSAIDLGANEGAFSTMLAQQGKLVVSADMDHYSVNRLYRTAKEKQWTNLHPVLLDLAHPSPALGVNLEERESFAARAPKGLVLALALIHHLAIGKNIPFEKIVRMMRQLGPWLVIEFIPKEDEKIATMLLHKKDIYEGYTQEGFLTAFSAAYQVRAHTEIGTSGRILYLMEAYGS